MVDYEIGCVLFLDNESVLYENKHIIIPKGTNGIGYSSSKGYFKVDDYTELEDDIFWITNFPKEFFIINNLNKNNIKPDNFFKIKLNSLIYELGMTGLHRQIIAKEISIIGKNTINRLQKSYNFNLNSNTLSNVLSKSFKLNKIKDLYNQNYLNDNQSNFFITNLKKGKNENQIYLKFNRYDYIRALCKTAFPSEGWSLLDNNSKEDKNRKIFNKITNNKEFAREFISKYKCCISVKLTNIDNKINSLLPNHYKNKKVVINDQEFLYFSMYSNVHIDSLYISKSKNHLEDIEPKKLFKVDNIDKNSISSGLAAYSYLHSFLDISENSSISNWIKIKDRLKMMEISRSFLDNNIKVISYGNGGILISIEDKDIDKMIILSEKFELIYPTFILTKDI